MTLSLPDDLSAHDGRDVWGISPSALTLAVNARETGRWDALRRYYDIQVLVTNYDPGWTTYRTGVECLCDTWIDSPLDTAAAFIRPTSAATFFAGAAYFDTPSEIANVLVNGQAIVADADADDPPVMPRRDLVGYAESELSRRLLRSLDVIQPVESGFRLNREIFENIAIGFEGSREEAAATLLAQLLDHLGVDSPSDVLSPLLTALGIDPPDDPVRSGGALPVLIRHHSLSGFVNRLFDEPFETVVADLRADLRTDLDRLDKARRFGTNSTATVAAPNWPIPSPEADVCALASQRDTPVVADWLASRRNTPPLAILDQLRDAGVEVTYRDGLFWFERAYEPPTEARVAVDGYSDWIERRVESIRAQRDALAQVASHAEDLWTKQRHAVLASSVHVFGDWTVSPTRFIYSIFDPKYHADEYDIEQYVGPSDELRQEVGAIREWRQQRRHDTESFAELVPEVVNYPIEHGEAEDIVRIMCPWTNFAIQDYTALFNRLLDNDVTIQLLMRLPTSREWNRLKSNLLSRLGDTHGNLELRSYTRYREFRDHSELRDLDEQTERRQRTGVHAKLFIAGASDHGTVLAGSANLMENSFFYNPEAGIQSRNPNLVAAAIDYFDLVWRLASPDRISEDAFTEESPYRFFPRVYRPQ